ncbi:MAG: hypothetical protein JW925_11860 [Syntrophaceae bacterium]|nr:hypothetical protein [Syntrophaceae bacterium]
MNNKYQIEPPKKWIKTQITRLSLYFLGMGIETAYKNIPEVKKEMDSLPRPFSFCFSVNNGPSMMIFKNGNKVEYVGEKEGYHVDLELVVKNIEFAYLAMTGRMSTPDLVYHNRQFVRGELNHMMVMIRVMNAAQTLLFPGFLLRFYIKEVPPLTMKTLINMVKAYTNATIGFFI